ncbi:MAG: phenylacetate-CoA oxygenase subunit PaaC [Flavobacteriia bacterium]|nr:phenylacetate-CoA oxygenase subunit PaaC [Flavobacteriia bacterium]
MTQQEALFKYTLRLGDNALIQGHRLSEWCSKGPILEEDLALTNIALDNIGLAQAFLKYAGTIEGKGKTEDDLAYKRAERQFYNNQITELPIGDFAVTIAKQLLISTFEVQFFTALSQSTDETIAGIAAKGLKESRYHFVHSRDWCFRLGEGTEVSHAKLQQAFNELWPYTGELFEMVEEDNILLVAGIAADLSELQPILKATVATVLKEATIQVPEDGYMHTGSRNGIHTEHLGHILAEMQYLQRAYPDATW